MTQKLKIVYRPLKELTPYINNAMIHDDKQISQIVASIEQFGWTNPILIDEFGEIIAGHGRLIAAEQLGFNPIPTITLVGLTEAQKKAYRVADNKIPLNAGWDSELLKLEFSELQDLDFDLSLTGFSEHEIDVLLGEVGSLPESEDPYTTKIDSPIYEPTGETPAVAELYSEEKTEQLREKIKNAKIPKEIEVFLLSAAERHTVFNFRKIADYYSNAPADVQLLFEESALVIIDFRQAIENGFVQMTKNMVETMFGEDESDA